MDYYITLLSNAQDDIYPTNKPWKFKTRLEKPIQMLPGMSIALAEISFSTSYVLSDENDDGKIQILDFLHTEDGGDTFGKWTEEKLTKNCFCSPDELVVCLNEIVWRNIPRIRDNKIEIFSWDAAQERIWAHFKDEYFITVLIENAYLYKLGVINQKDRTSDYIALGHNKRKEQYQYQGKTRKFTQDCQQKYLSVCRFQNYFEYAPHIFNVSEFIVYSDLVQQHFVGGSLVSSLRYVTPQTGNSSQRQVDSFSGNRLYYELSRNFIKETEIEIRAPDGTFVPFSKPIRLVLHFKSHGSN